LVRSLGLCIDANAQGILDDPERYQVGRFLWRRRERRGGLTFVEIFWGRQRKLRVQQGRREGILIPQE